MTLLIYFAALLLFVWMVKPVQVPGRLIVLFRAFFPSWKFFDDIGTVAELQYRVRATSQVDFGPWERCIPRQKRSLKQVLWNPEGNLALAYQSLVEQFLNELAESPPGGRTSYPLIQKLVQTQITANSGAQYGFEYQFKIVDGEDLMISPVLHAE